MIRLYRFLSPFKARLGVILVLTLLQSLANLYLPNLMADIVDTGIVNYADLYNSQFTGAQLEEAPARVPVAV